MRRILFLAGILVAVSATQARALNPLVAGPEAVAERDLGGIAAAAHSDTIWFGGSGTGDGSVARGGTWTWEADSGEPPEFFPDGDPVGNQYRDGWTFEDRTARRGPSQTGAGHWRADGTYDFDFDGGAFAHRATTHANDGVNDGPDPLAEPGIGGSWSVWIGTNLYLNPEDCAWGQTAGYGDGWSQGIRKTYTIPQGTPAGTQYAIRFFHRYAVEDAFDTCWVETSLDGIYWDQVGTAISPNGIFNGGYRGSPRPTPAGAADVVDLITWPGSPGGPAELHVRFRLVSDSFFSDNNEGGSFLFAWQLDNIRFLRNGAPQDDATFESGMDGWAPASFEGFDFQLTGDPDRPAGRIVPISTLACPPVADCPESCGLENRILIFVDKDDCDQNDAFADTYVNSRPFAIGGPANPDIDGDGGRLLRYDIYIDGGTGFFEVGLAFCWVYWPFDAGRCPYTPPGGAPGAGTTFNWSQTGFSTCDYFAQGVGPRCIDNGIDEISANLPATADSVLLHVGAFSACRSEATCDLNDNGAPFFDNLRFGVFSPQGQQISSNTIDRYSDNFPTSNGDIRTATCRSDGAHSFPGSLGIEIPLRFVRADTAVVATGAVDAAMYLRFRVLPGPCQPNLSHAFFTAFPPNAWHAARMDTGRTQGTGNNSPGSYMTCFHESDPRNGTHWTGAPPAVEPCDDILPDKLLTAGTRVQYFFELRSASSGDVLGTFPRRRDSGPIGTSESYSSLWLEMTNLPELDQVCDGSYAHNLLVVSDYQTTLVPGNGALHRDRLTTTLASLGLDFDVYDCVGTNFTSSYNGIGRREDRPTQAPRPPMNGATQPQLEPYDCIWYYAGLSTARTLSDQETLSTFGGQPSIDQQKLETWIAGCSAGANRLLVLEGLGWASDIDINTTHGPAFLARFGVDVLTSDYAQGLAANDLRRCARVAGTLLAPAFDGEVLGSGCPDNLNLDVFGAVSGGEAVVHFLESLEAGNDPVNCADDVDRLAWHAVIRKTNPGHTCERSVAMSFPFAYLFSLNCTDQCLFDDYRINGENAELVIGLFQWAGKPINSAPIGVGEAGTPRFANALERARPNPANPGAVIRYSIAERGRVTLRIFDVGGRLVRALVDEVRDAGEHTAGWNGRNDAGERVSSGVYFYELRAPGYAASRKLVILP